MATSLSSVARQASGCLAIILLSPTAVRAHVALDSPNGGEILNVDSVFTIQWHPTVQHGTIDWDLWYSTTSTNGPWEAISLDLPLGNPAAGSPHSYDWLVPNLGNTEAWVRVRQDNSGTDYYDASDASFSIVAPVLAGDFNEDGLVNSADLTNWQTSYGTQTGAAHTSGDADGDGDVDGHDFLIWQEQNSLGGVTTKLRSVPEPLTLPLWLLGSLATLRCRFC